MIQTGVKLILPKRFVYFDNVNIKVNKICCLSQSSQHTNKPVHCPQIRKVETFKIFPRLSKTAFINISIGSCGDRYDLKETDTMTFGSLDIDSLLFSINY